MTEFSVLGELSLLKKEYIWTKYKHYTQVFTDASKDPGKGQVGVCIHNPKTERRRGKKDIRSSFSVYERITSNSDSN